VGEKKIKRVSGRASRSKKRSAFGRVTKKDLRETTTNEKKISGVPLEGDEPFTMGKLLSGNRLKTKGRKRKRGGRAQKKAQRITGEDGTALIRPAG